MRATKTRLASDERIDVIIVGTLVALLGLVAAAFV
jgi:hypothetical protein